MKNIKIILILSFLFIFLNVSLAAASMSAVYVATDGSGDYNCDGSKDQIEINKAFEFIANNDKYDTVYLKSGTYVIDAPIKITDNAVFTGDSDATVRLVEDWYVTRDDMFTPMITGSHSTSQKGNDGTNIVIKGFRLYGDGWKQSYIHAMGEWDSFPAIYFHNADRITIQDMTFDDIPGDGIRMYGAPSGMDTRYKILNNTFNGVGHESIYLQGSEYNLVDGNTIRMIKGPYSEWYDCGIRLDNSAHNLITNNSITIDNLGNSAIFLSRRYDSNPVENNTIAYNIIYNTSEMGIFLSRGYAGTVDEAKDTYIHHNILYNTGINANSYESVGGGIWIYGFNNTIIENNVIDGSVGDAIAHKTKFTGYVMNSTGGLYTTVRNNIITNTVGSDYQTKDGYAINNLIASSTVDVNFIVEYNDIYNSETGNYYNVPTHPTDVFVNPLFADRANHDYHLQSTAGRWTGSTWTTDAQSSPLIDAGDPDSDYSNELASGDRINIGAYGNTVQASLSYSLEEPVEEETPVPAEDDGVVSTELNISYGTATIDGSLADWEESTGIVLYGDSGRSADKENVATIKAMYDDTNLYLVYDVTDTNLQATRLPGSGGLHLDDSIEMYIDTLNNGGIAMQPDDYQIIINLNEAVIDDVGTGSGKDYTYTMNADKSVNLKGTLNNAADIDTGYVIELSIPWENIGGIPSNEIVGILVAVNDKDSESGVYLINSCQLPGAYAVPDNWGEVIIEEPEQVIVNTAPEFNTIADLTTAENEAISFTVSATDAQGDDLVYSASSLPEGASFDAGTATFSWTPSTGDAGIYEVTFTVTDGSLSDSESVTMTVVNTAPEFDAVSAVTITETEVISFTISATDAEGNELTYSAISLPDGASFNADTATFNWATTQNDAGSYAAVFEVTDGSLSDTVSVSITVEELAITEVGELSIVRGTAAIDGTTGDWTGVTGITLYGVSGRAAVKENTATIKAMYDDENLYLVYDVEDTDLQATRLPGSGGLHLDDSIEMYIDTQNNGGTAMQPDDYQIIINLNGAVIDDVGTGTGKDYSYVINADMNVKLEGTLNDATNTDTGYVIEVAIPWADIGGTPADVVGLLVAVNDRDVEGDVYLLNYGDIEGSYAVPDKWEDVSIEEPTNSAPAILLFEPADGSTYEEGSSVFINAFATDADGQSLSYVIKIDGAEVSTSSSYTWNTDYQSAGTHTLEVTVTDGIATARSTSIVTITDLHPRWDVNEDGVVSLLDIDVISKNYGSTYTGDLPRWDVNQDGVINVADLTLVLDHIDEEID